MSGANSSCSRDSIVRFVFAVLALFSVQLVAQHAPTTGSTVHTGLPDDWTHHHLVFSPAGSEKDAIRRGRHQDWQRIVNDRRYVMLQTKRHAAATIAESRGARAGSHDRRHGHRESVPGSIHSDWQMNLGSSATVGAGQYPAKYSFSTTTAGTCAGDAGPDFVVYNTGQAGSNSGTGEANIVAYDNLYSGCSGTVPTVYWSYYTGTGTAATSVVLSLDGSKVAFIETSAGGATLRILKWKAGEGTDSNAPAVPDYASLTSWSACPASSSCLISIPLSGGYSDTISAPYYDYDSDTLWAGDSAGYLHEFTGVFLGTPTEVTSGGWPVFGSMPCGGGALSSPVYDQVHALIYVGNACGTLDAITTAGAVTSSAQIGFGFTDLQEAPLVDPAAGEVYVFVSADSYSGSAQAGVFQFPYNFSAGATGTEAQTGQATSTPMYRGTFDNSYFTSTSWSSPTGTLWVCGNTGGYPTLYPISITNGVMASGAIAAGPVVSATATTCSPVTEFCTNGGADCTFSAGTDSIAVSPQTEPATPTINGCSGSEGCVITYTVSGTTATLARAGAFAGGASGMVVDTQNLATAGAFQLYFGTLGIQSCAGSGGFGTGSGGCAIQAPISGTDFSLSANPTTLQLSPGGAAQAITLSATALSGFSETVHVTFSGLPAGVTASPATLDLTPGTPQQVSFSAASNAATGTASVQVNGTSGTLSHSVSLDVSVAATVDVVTYHNDVARTGLYPQETMLSPADVNSSQFGLLRVLAMDEKVDGQPLYLSGLTIGGQQHNVVYGVSEHDSVYAFDADTGAQIWHTSVLGANETTSDDRGCYTIEPEIGITSTPVIDRQAGPHGILFVVGMSKDSSGGYHQRLHALDVTTGAEMPNSPTEIRATYPGTGANSSGGNVIFDPGQYVDRVALLLLNGTIYVGWSSHCDEDPYTGWLMGYSESTLAQTSVLNVTPNGSEGSIWMSDVGLSADPGGNIYFLDANGTFDTDLDANGFPAQHDFGNAFMKVSTSGGNLAVADYFATSNTVAENDQDQDLGSGGALVLPDVQDASGNVVHLAVGAGKDGTIYVVNRDAMGKFNPQNDNAIYQEITGGAAVYGMAAYFNNEVYYGGVKDTLKAWPITAGRLAASPSAQTATKFQYPGTTPAVSANGTVNGIVWAVQNVSPAVLHAYDATALKELYNSNQAANGRDHFGNGNKFITPIIVNGKVFVGTPSGIAEFGLLQ